MTRKQRQRKAARRAHHQIETHGRRPLGLQLPPPQVRRREIANDVPFATLVNRVKERMKRDARKAAHDRRKATRAARKGNRG